MKTKAVDSPVPKKKFLPARIMNNPLSSILFLLYLKFS